ncbi:MAG: response regulator [Spirochaetaceae bacterium]|nr:MAG: response regulator [Spirochaetaceae bacterium]
MYSKLPRIIIIDDDLDILETTGALLQSAGFEIHSSDSVEEGLEMIARLSPDLVLLDLLFPEHPSSGFRTAGTIKANYPNLPLFVLTSINREYALEFTRDELQAEEYVTKPVRIERLVELIHHYIS